MMTTPSRVWRWAPLAAAALLLPFANGDNSVPLVAWLTPILVMRFVRGQPARVGLPISYVLLTAALAVQFRSMPLAGVAFFATMVAIAIPVAIPYALDRWLGPRLDDSVARIVLFPAAATALQFLPSFGRFGSWGTVAYSQYGNSSLLQLASVTGLWGIDFLIFAAAPVVNRVWERGVRAPSAMRPAAAFVAITALVLLVGGARLTLFPPPGKTVRIASLSHADIEPGPDGEQWNRILNGNATAADRALFTTWAKAVDDDLLARADREAAAGAKLVFWDETGAAVLASDEPAFVARGIELATRHRIYLGMALGTWTLGAAHPLENKLLLIDPSGRLVWEYHKSYPVPGIEAPFVTRGDGRVPRVDTPFGRVSAIICADADYPRLMAQTGAMKADIVLDPSSDWREIDPWHTRMASFRAIEEGVTLVRQTFAGLSAAFDAHGVPLASMDHFQTDDRVMVAQVPTEGVRTIYARLGDWFGWLCVVAVLVLMALAYRTPSSAAGAWS